MIDESTDSESDSTSECESITETVMKNAIVQYHPRYRRGALDLFNLGSTDSHILEIVSSDRITFCVHPLVMRMSSNVFNDMMSTARDDGDAIAVEEGSDVFAALLDIISPNIHHGLELIPSVNFAARVLRAAEKYDIQKVVQIFRDNITSYPLFAKEPIASFGVACEHGWALEASLLSTASLKWDLRSPEALRALSNLYPKDILKLQFLHSTRRSLLSKSLGCVVVKAIDSSTERTLGIRVLSPWSEKHEQSLTALKYLVNMEMEKCASASTLQAAFWARLDVANLFRDDGWRKDYIASEVLRMISLLPLSIKELDEFFIN